MPWPDNGIKGVFRDPSRRPHAGNPRRRRTEFEFCEERHEIVLIQRLDGGGGGIRTHETVSRLPVFKTGAFNHSATPPALLTNDLANPVLAENPKLAPDWHRNMKSGRSLFAF